MEGCRWNLEAGKGQKNYLGTSLVVQWLRIYLVMQGTWVQSLVGKLRSHHLSLWAAATEHAH